METEFDLYYALLGNFVSYETLFPISKKLLYDYRGEAPQLDFYIDINSYIKSFWYPRKYSYKNINVLTANLINCCAHYRNYFWTRHTMKTRFFLVWADNIPESKPLEYNAHYKERVNTASIAGWQAPMINFTKKALAFLCKYLPQIYFIEGGTNETAGVISALIKQNSVPANPKVILSKDAYCYQLVAYHPNTFILRPKKRKINGNSVDASWLVTKTNLFNALKEELGYKQTAVFPSNVQHLDCVLGLSGLKARHIRGVMTVSKACDLIAAIEQAAPEHLDSPEKLEMSIKLNPVDVERGVNPIGLSITANLLDARIDELAFVSSPLFVEVSKSIVDLYNPQAVMEISNHEYQDYPLELMEL